MTVQFAESSTRIGKVDPSMNSVWPDAPNDDFRSIFKTPPSPMWVYDLQTLKFLIVNDAARDLYGYSHAAFSVMTVLDIRPAEERARMLEAVHQRPDMETAQRWTHLKAD